jgi:MoxR-like ATPase
MAASNPIDFATLKVILPFIKDAVLLRGPHGIGKSAVPAGVSKTSGKRLLDVRLSLFTEGDLVGVPDHERIKSTGVTSFAPPDWLHAACNEPVVLFLDEINRATPGVQNSAFQLVLDREVKGWRLHPETLVFAAINDSPEYNVNEMDPALLDRFVTYDLVPTHKDWLVWAVEEGLDELLVDFIRQHPEHLRPTKAVEPGSITPTQRSWARLAKTLSDAGTRTACPRASTPSAWAMWVHPRRSPSSTSSRSTTR